MSDIRIEQIKPEDEELLEEWTRVTTQEDLLGVGSFCSRDADWPWGVFVSVMEFIRVEPLESELSAAITSALAGVPGVKQVHHEDRETWVIRGRPDGSALVRAAAEVVDRFEPRTRAVYDSLDSGK